MEELFLIYLNFFSSYTLNKEIPKKFKTEKNQPLLYEFDKNDWFIKEIIDKKNY